MTTAHAISPAARIGRFWFRRRGVSPVPLLLAVVLLPPDFRLPTFALASVVALCLAGELLRLRAVGFAGSATRTRGDRVPRLFHSGPYRYLRNPLYVANTGLYTGCALLFGFGWLSLVVLVYSCVQYALIVAYEESLLEQTFGEPYRRYVANVPRWFPRLAPWETTGESFSWRVAVRSERTTLVAIATMAALWSIKDAYLSK